MTLKVASSVGAVPQNNNLVLAGHTRRLLTSLVDETSSFIQRKEQLRRIIVFQGIVRGWLVRRRFKDVGTGSMKRRRLVNTDLDAHVRNQIKRRNQLYLAILNEEREYVRSLSLARTVCVLLSWAC